MISVEMYEICCMIVYIHGIISILMPVNAHHGERLTLCYAMLCYNILPIQFSFVIYVSVIICIQYLDTGP